MPKSFKLDRRSVGTQGEVELAAVDDGINKKLFAIGNKFSNLCKKAAYRNLLQRSITVEASERGNPVKKEGSRATQTGKEPEDSEDDRGRKSKMAREESIEVTSPSSTANVFRTPSLLSEDHLLEDSPRVIVSHEEVPGTSKLTSRLNLLDSALLQFQSAALSAENSMAVIYSCDDRVSHPSRMSEIAYFCENQELQRQSDEAVLLVQDYQSYDILNTVRKQDATSACPKKIKKKKRRRGAPGVRPAPIIPNTSLTSDLVCRICHEGEDVGPLMRPCLCKGSVGNIHPKCLKVWLEQSNTSRCEICGYPYAIRQTKRYTKPVSVTVFLRSVVDRRALMYDVVSFVAVTPLCIVGIAMCIRASLVTTGAPGVSFQMGSVTRAGMIMLSSTIVIAYSVWLYTLLSYHYKTWKRWYNSCYEVEVIPVCMSSEERLDALRSMTENARRQGIDRGGSIATVLQPSGSYVYGSFYQRRVPAAGRVHNLPQ